MKRAAFLSPARVRVRAFAYVHQARNEDNSRPREEPQHRFDGSRGGGRQVGSGNDGGGEKGEGRMHVTGTRARERLSNATTSGDAVAEQVLPRAGVGARDGGNAVALAGVPAELAEKNCVPSSSPLFLVRERARGVCLRLGNGPSNCSPSRGRRRAVIPNGCACCLSLLAEQRGPSCSCVRTPGGPKWVRDLEASLTRRAAVPAGHRSRCSGSGLPVPN